MMALAAIPALGCTLLLAPATPETAQLEGCGPLPGPASPAPDAAEAAHYAAVGEAERAAGDMRTAAVAFRKALDHDPGHAGARAALSAICRATGASAPAAVPDRGRGEQLFARGLAAYQSGDWDEARAALSRAAREHPELAADASFFLGMMAYREGDGAGALRAFDRAGEDPAYRTIARVPRRLAARNRRLALMLLAQSEYDSNVKLLPETPPALSTLGTPVADLSLLTVASAAARPMPWLALHNNVLWRRQRELHEHDVVLENPSLGLHAYRGRHQGSARFDLDWQWLQGNLYQQAQQAAVEYRYLAGRYGLRAAYSFRHRTFDQARSDFRGFVHMLTTEATRVWPIGVSASSGLLAMREQTARSEFSHHALGAQLGLGWQGRLLYLAATARGLGARYRTPDALGVLRSDLRSETSLDLELALHDQLALTAGADATVNFSSVGEFRYRKLVMRIGLAGFLGWL